jgi:hypothetical protein
MCGECVDEIFEKDYKEEPKKSYLLPFNETLTNITLFEKEYKEKQKNHIC